MHLILGHASPEVIQNVQNASRDVVIDHSLPAPKTIQCEACSVSKATEIVNRSPEVEEVENDTPFDRIVWDMGFLDQAYNGDLYYSHLHYCKTLFNIV